MDQLAAVKRPLVYITMSRFEVSSVLLGAISLVITSLELHSQGVPTVKRFLRFCPIQEVKARLMTWTFKTFIL